MAIPDYQTLMAPVLKCISDGHEHSLRETISALSDEFGLTVEERKILLPSGGQPLINNRVAWAVTYLRQAGLLENVKRGVFKITERGKHILAEHPDRVDNSILAKFSEFKEFKNRNKKDNDIKNESVRDPISDFQDETNPEETLETAFQELQDGLVMDVLDAIKQCPPEFFEQLVIDVLIKMGYGGSRKEAGAALGRSGDEGIDGIIKEDKLGLGIIYIQAKRWDKTTVGRPEIQRFAGALLGQAAKKGIFLTTSNFTREAEDYVKGLDAKIILIDGERLAELMVEYNVGVNVIATYEVKKVDSDYFIEE